MNVNGIKRAEDLPFKVPEPLAEAVNELVDAMERDDRELDCYQDELEGMARMVRGQREAWLNAYYLEGGWREDVERTTLLHAARHGRTDEALALIEAGADLNAVDRAGWSPLMNAVRDGNTALALALIEAGADLNAALTREIDENFGPEPVGTTALTHSLRWGQGKAARLLVEAGADVNTKDAEGVTPLMYAVRFREDMTAPLLAAGADVNAKTESGWTALVFAAQWRHTATARTLVRAGADAAHAEAVLRRAHHEDDALTRHILAETLGVLRAARAEDEGAPPSARGAA